MCSISVPDSVYEPHEDSELLAAEAMKKCSGKILEIGCGSGFVCIALAKANPQAQIYACDINARAVEACRKNALASGVEIEVFESDLFSGVREKEFGWILFNPPYLPTKKAEKLEGGINYAFDGGKGGLETVFRFLKDAGGYLKKEGRILLVCSSAQDLPKLNGRIRDCGFSFGIVARESFFFEKIYVYEVWKKGG